MNAMLRAVSTTSCSRLGAFLAAAALLFAGATGCGDSTDNSPTPGDDSSESSAAASDEAQANQAMHADPEDIEGCELIDRIPNEEFDTGPNPTCGQIGDILGEDWFECKIEASGDQLEEGTYGAGGEFSFDGVSPECETDFLVEISNMTSDGTFDWESNLGVDAVVVKAGPGGNLYLCDPESTAGHDFESGQGDALSHVSFCWDFDPDVKVTKEAAETPIDAGDNATFDLTVENIGEVAAEDVTLDDVLPDTGDDEDINWVIDSLTKDGDPLDMTQCEITDPADSDPDDILACDFDDPLEPGEVIEISVSRLTSSDDCGTLDNLVTVSAVNEPGDLLENNEDDASIDVECPNITVEKTADSSPINAGETAQFDITVSNEGPGDATNVTVSDTLEGTGWDFVSPVEGCSLTPDTDTTTLSCTFASLAADDSIDISVERETSATADDCDDIPNTVTVGADNEPSDQTGDNEDSATIVVDCPDVTVEKLPDSSDISAGETATFTIEVTNDGPGTAFDVELDDTLPGTGWSTSDTGCDITSNTNDELHCDLGDLAEDASTTVTVSKMTSAADCGVLDNTAEVSASNEDPDATDNNSDDGQITVQCPDLVIEKSPDGGEVTAGEDAVFTIEVTNNGPGTAFNVMLTDTLPGTGWTEDDARCEITSGTNDELECDLGDLANGASTTVTVTKSTTADDCGLLDNTATVDADNDSPVSDPGDITVLCPDVDISKTADPATISGGETAEFDIVVANNGDGTATNVILTDTLPGTGWSVTGDDADDCDPLAATDGDEELTCDFGNIPSGESRSITVSRMTTVDDCDGIENTASITVDNDADDSDTDTITVNCPDIGVEKTADPEIIELTRVTDDEQDGQFEIVVTNHGPGTAFDVELSDPLPDNGDSGVNWTIVSETTLGTVAGLECDDPLSNISDSTDPNFNDDLLHCTADEMAEGASFTVTVVRTFEAGADSEADDDCVDFPNTAFVSASNEVDGSAPNLASATIIVECAGAPVDDDFQACTPGFWQGGAGSTLWDEYNDEDWTAHCDSDQPFTHDKKFNDYFASHDNLEGLTMYDLVSTGGGPDIVRKTARYLVAAYLNASCDSVNTQFTPEELAAMWADAVDPEHELTFSELFLTLEGLFVDEFGEELMCPIPLEGVDLEPNRPKKNKGPQNGR